MVVGGPLTTTLRGLVIDEVTEVLPAPTVTTGLSWSQFSRYRPEGTAGGSTIALDDAHGPIERIVEREAILTPADPLHTPWVAAVHAGRAMRRHLTAHGLGTVADALLAQPELRFHPVTPDDAVLGEDERRYSRLLSDKVLDSAMVLMLVKGGGPPAAATQGADFGRLAQALQAWQQPSRLLPQAPPPWVNVQVVTDSDGWLQWCGSRRPCRAALTT